MPLIGVDMIEGRKQDEIKALLDAIHRAVVAGFKVPQGDRYQIVHEHPPAHFIVEATGLDITRTRKCVVIQVMTRPHEREAKESFYKAARPGVGDDMRPGTIRRSRLDGHELGRGLVLREWPRAIPYRRTGL